MRFPIAIRRSVVVALTALSAGCNDSPPLGLPGEVGTGPLAPRLSISDAVHNGNAHFFWLPPTVGSVESYNGEFDGSRSPSVVVCELPNCAAQVVVYTMTSGLGSETLRVVSQDEHYIVNWHTDQLGEPGRSYRIKVIVEAQELGHLDVHLSESAKEAKNLTTEEIIGLKDGRTLPIKFRIEDGALGIMEPIRLGEIIAADFDSDGRPDIGGKLPDTGEIVWFRNLGEATAFAPAIPILEAGGSADLRLRWRGGVADLNLDAAPDLLLRNLEGDEVVWLENGNAGESWLRHTVATGLSDVRGMAASDLDGDSRPDIIAADASGGTVAWYRNLGSGAFGSQQIVDHASWPQGVLASDLDADGDLDVVSVSEAETVEIQWHDNKLATAGNFGAPQPVSGVQPDPSHVQAEDLDGDGDPDLVTRSNSGSKGYLFWHENRLSTGQSFVSNSVMDLDQRIGMIFMRDLDGDGDRDLVLEESNSNSVVWFENVAGPGFGPRQTIGVIGSGDYMTYPVDLDHDGDIDLLALDVDTQGLSWFENSGGGSVWIEHNL